MTILPGPVTSVVYEVACCGSGAKVVSAVNPVVSTVSGTKYAIRLSVPVLLPPIKLPQ